MATEAPPVVETPSPTPIPAPVVPRSESPEPTPEELATQAQEKLTKLEGFWNKVNPPKEGKETPSEPQPDEKKPKAKAKEIPPPAPPEDKPKAKRRTKEPEIDPIALAEATGREIAREMAREKAPVQPKEPEVELELPEEFARDVQVFDEMAKMKPKEYGDIRKKLAKYAKAEDDYRTKWEQEHPDEEFDPDSDEHDDFYKRIKPDYEQRDFESAKESLIEQRAAARAEERLRQEFEQREKQREQAGQIKPEIEREMVGLMGDMLKEADPDNAELAKDWASIQLLDEKNPLLADVMVGVHNETRPVLEATRRLFRGIDRPDQNNAAHQRVFALISETEEQVKKMPLKERYDEEGRLFATQDEYSKMNPAERQKHWYIGENELAAVVRGKAIGQTKIIYQRERQRIERYTKGGSKTEQTKRQPQEEHAPKHVTTSPSVSGRSTLPGDGTPNASKPSNGKDWFFNKFLGA